MSPEAQRVAIAEWMGWNPNPHCYDEKIRLWRNEGSKPPRTREFSELPDYPNDLNAIHEAEKRLSVNEWTPYLDHLDKICVPVHICPTTHAMACYCATAAQRCEALLRILNLWKE